MRRLVVPMLDGKLIADVSTDPDYPGIDVEFVSDKDNGTDLSRPRVLIEQAPEEGVRVLIWNNPKSENFELGCILYPEKENTLTEINEKGKLIVPVKSGVLIATAEDTGIFVELIIRGKWHPKVFIHQTDEKIHATIWNKPYTECATNNIEIYSCKTNRSGMSIRTLIQNLQEIEKNIRMQLSKCIIQKEMVSCSLLQKKTEMFG